MEVSTLSKRYIQRTWGWIFSFVLVMSAMNNVHAQTQLAAWSFPTTDAAPNTPTSFLSEFGEQENTAAIYADGTNGSSTFVQTGSPELTMFGGSTVNDPKSSPSNTGALALANQSANGKSIVIKFSMTGYENPVMTYATRGTNTGFNTHTWAYSTDGVNFTQVKVITGRTNTNFTTQEVDLTDEDGVDNAATVYLRVTVTGASNTTGNNRFDNIQIHADEATASNPPVVTSDMYFEEVGVATSIQIEASNPPITGYALATGSSLPAGLALNTTTGEIYGTPTTAGYYEFDVNATNSAGTSADATIAIDISAGNQTISFGALSDVTYGDPSFNLSATATSGLPVSFYSSNTLVATVSGNTVTIVGAGTTTITAAQDGDADWNPALNVQQTLTVNKADQTITFDPLADKLDSDAPFNLTATATSGLTVSYTSSNPAVATVSGNTVTIVGVGTTTITAAQSGNGNYNAATSVNQDLNVLSSSKLNQSITFGALSDVTYGDANFNLTATASSSLPVSYISSNTSVATVSGNTVTIVGVGTTTITASQEGDATYNPAPDETQDLTVNVKTLTVSGLVVNDKDYDGTTAATLNTSSATLNGVVGSDNVDYNATAEFQSADAGTGVNVDVTLGLTGTDAGNYTISNVVLTADINQAAQTITFGALAPKSTADAPFDLTASASSGLTVTYTSSDPLVATVSGNTVTIVGAGTTTITASQAGNGNYLAATDVTQNLVVTVEPIDVLWTFTGPSAAPVAQPTGMSISDVSRGNAYGSSPAALLTTSSGSSGYTGASGSVNAGIPANKGALNTGTSPYFEFTVTADAGKRVTINSVGFGARSTNTGPQAYSVNSSADAYASSLLTGSIGNNSSWSYKSGSLSSALVVEDGASVTIRIYGYGGSGSPALNTTNWRIDDLTFSALVETMPDCSGTPVVSVTGNSTYCVSGNTVLTATTGGDAYQWSDANGEILGATGETFTASAAGDYFVTVTYGPCTAISDPFTVTELSTPAIPTITGIENVCPYLSTLDELTYSVENPVPGETYTWTVPYGVNIVSGQGTSSLTVTIDLVLATRANKQIRVAATNDCGTGAQAIYYLKTHAPTTPQPISGPVDACSYIGNATLATYSINPVDAATSYQWVVPTGATIINNNGTSIDVEFDNTFTTNSIIVYALNGCGVSDARSISVSKSAPSTPGVVSGNNSVCLLLPSAQYPSGTNGIYSVAEVGVNSYVWNVPTGATIVDQWSADGRNYIEVSFSSSYTTGNITVYATNGCGVSGNRTFALSKLKPAAPGNVDQLEVVTCPDRQYSYTLPNVPSQSNWLEWTVPVGATIVSGQGTTSILVSYPNTAVEGEVTVVASNGCYSSAVRKLYVKISACEPAEYAKPTVPVATTGTAIEALDVQIFPNPAVDAFRLTVKAAGTERVAVNVMDITGRSHTKTTARPGQTIQFGSTLKSGTYFVELIQGKERKVVKVIKL